MKQKVKKIKSLQLMVWKPIVTKGKSKTKKKENFEEETEPDWNLTGRLNCTKISESCCSLKFHLNYRFTASFFLIIKTPCIYAWAYGRHANTFWKLSVPSSFLESLLIFTFEQLKYVLLQFFKETQHNIPVKNAVSLLGTFVNTAPKFPHQSCRFCSGMRGTIAFGTMRLLSCSSVLGQQYAVGDWAVPHT